MTLARFAGLASAIAIAWTISKVYTRAPRIKPAVIQNRFYADTNYDSDIRAYCDQQQIVYQSFWTLSANARLLAHKAITGPAATHKRTPAQILFRYLTQIGVVPLTGTKSEAHMREDLSIFDFELSHAECNAIDRDSMSVHSESVSGA